MQRTQFTPAPEYLETLQAAIRKAHGCSATHESTWMGVEFAGPLMWSGSVEVFRLREKRKARRVFAWSKVEDGQLHCYLVLEGDGISTPREAVRRALTSQQMDDDDEMALAS